MAKYFHNYAVLDPKYPGDPQFWSLEGYSFGDAAKYGWTHEFAPDASKTTQLLRSNLERKVHHMSLAIQITNSPREPKWGLATSYDQLQISVETNEAFIRKLFLYHVRVLRVGRETDDYRHRIFKGPTRIVYLKVGAGGIVESPQSKAAG
jgi:hypothetical protein